MTQPSPPRQPIPFGAQMTIRLTQGTQPAAIVLGFARTGDPLDEAAVRTAAHEIWSIFRPIILSEVVMTGAVWRDAGVVDGDSVEVGAPTGTAANIGAAGGSSALAAACTLIRWSTGGGGRSGRGRTYLPGLAAASVAAGGREYVTTYRNTVQSQITSYLGSTVVKGAGFTPAVLSFTKGTLRPIEAGVLAPVVGVQRRRMR